MNTNDADWGDEDSTRSRTRLQLLIEEYRMLLYAFGVVLLLAVLGAVIDALAGPMNDSTELMHQVAGLLGATALAIAICLVLVMGLWAVLVLTNR